jgi:dihydroxy-acid dehydratase
MIILDVPARRLDLDVAADELAARTPDEKTTTAYANPQRGWERLYVQTVQQANVGADLDFLNGASGHQVSRESH